MQKATICLKAYLATCLATCLALPLSGSSANAQNEGDKKREQIHVIVFVCEHGAAKSIVAAAHFNKLAGERGLNFRAIARGTSPDKEVAPKVVEWLRADGLVAGESAPKKISAEDLAGAVRVITFCALPDDYAAGVKVDSWEGVPSMNEDYDKTRDWLVDRINGLLKELRRK
jgi:protein-tyrosine-phosphatase